MIQIVRYVRKYVIEAKNENMNIDIDILKSALIFQYLQLKHYGIHLSIQEILETAGDDIGLIGPSKGLISWILQKIFKHSFVMRTHAIFHDAFGRFYEKYQKDRGYTYAFKNAPNIFKRSMFCGQISGLIYCKWNNITI